MATTMVDSLAVLTCARLLYVQNDSPILKVFDMAAEKLNAPEEIKNTAIRQFVWAMPSPGRVMRIEDMLVSELISIFDAAIREQRINGAATSA